MFCSDLSKYIRRKTLEVNIGGIAMGANHSIRIQSMTNTNTLDVEATVEQCMRIADAGADYVRCTVQGLREADAMKEIKQHLRGKGYNIPLIADVHFSAQVAEAVAAYVDKVRINPGNFIDKRADFSRQELSDEEYAQELKRLEEAVCSLLNICKKHGTAIRIGVNHGSLSDRIMSRYGDTPAGMVESGMEFLRVCKQQKFDNVVLSMKSSNTRVMVQAYRLLVDAMNKEGMSYPLHLGVTEAGEGEDGRIKSAVGIGTLLADGIGDTIRVSLTEAPENEIPVARQLVSYFENRTKHKPIVKPDATYYSPYEYQKCETGEVNGIGGANPTVVVADLSEYNPVYQKDIEALGFTLYNGRWVGGRQSPDAIYIGSSMFSTEEGGLRIISDETEGLFRCTTDMLNAELLAWLKGNPQVLLAVETHNDNAPADLRAFFLRLLEYGVKNPVIIQRTYNDTSLDELQIKAACDLGLLLIDGFGDGVMLNAPNLAVPQKDRALIQLTFSILQASRVRFSKTEYIACPSCGRTLFDLQTTLAQVKAATVHLSKLKIAVMGCIVNGPGEMADADYGYVGAGPGKVSLYKGKVQVKKNIPQEKAVEELITLIKENGDWEE